MTGDPVAASGTPMGASALTGVHYGRLTSHGDVRGTFTELWRASNPVTGNDAFVQANVSTSSPGVKISSLAN